MKLEKTKKKRKKKLKTMHETYGEGNDKLGRHLCCDRCGFCLTCKDCECK